MVDELSQSRSRSFEPALTDLPVLWLAVPWLAGVTWSLRTAQKLLTIGAPTGFVGAMTWLFAFWRFFAAAALGLALTWAWLYIAWPQHRRVLCWSALLGLSAFRLAPLSIQPVVPFFIAACMAIAVVEQSVAARRERARRVSAPAV